MAQRATQRADAPAAATVTASPAATSRRSTLAAGTSIPPAAAPRKYRSPNFFVGFRILNPAILTNVTQLQQRVATQFPEIAQCLIDARTLHVTLCTLHLANEQDIQNAIRIFEEHTHTAGVPPFGDDAPAFDFRGVDFFGKNYVLYTPLDVSSRYADTLADLAEKLHAAFDVLALTTGPYRKPYTPHLTLWKTTKFIKYIRQLNKQSTHPIEFALGDYLKQSTEPEHFGTERPTSIALLSMREKEADGFYKVCASASLVLTEASDTEDKGALPSEPSP